MQCPGGQKRAQERLEPELQTTVNCYVSAGNRTWLYLASTRGVRAAKPSLQPQATFLSYLFFSETNLKKCLPTSFTFFLRLDQLSSLLVHFNYGLTYYGFQHLQFDSEPKGNKHQEKKATGSCCVNRVTIYSPHIQGPEHRNSDLKLMR